MRTHAINFKASLKNDNNIFCCNWGFHCTDNKKFCASAGTFLMYQCQLIIKRITVAVCNTRPIREFFVNWLVNEGMFTEANLYLLQSKTSTTISRYNFITILLQTWGWLINYGNTRQHSIKALDQTRVATANLQHHKCFPCSSAKLELEGLHMKAS